MAAPEAWDPERRVGLHRPVMIPARCVKGDYMPEYKNKFKGPAYIEEVIVDEDGTVIGTIRIKPSSVLWKPANAQKFFAVPLDKFAEWIASNGAGAKKVTK
jgi:hypothetical protein